MVDYFRKRYKNKTEAELRLIASSSKHQKVAVIAAILELKKRNLNTDELENQHSQLQPEIAAAENNSKKDNDIFSKNIVTFSRGPQFWNGRARLPVFILMILLIIGLYKTSVKHYEPLLIVIPLFILVLFFTMDIRGAQVNQKDFLVRKYWMFCWIKFGKWKDMTPYLSVYLDHSTYSIKTFTFFTQVSTYKRNYFGSVTNGHFVVSLLNHDDNSPLVIGEREKYKDAKEFAMQCSVNLGLELHDNFKIRLQKSKQRRKTGIRR